jgi:translation initiation factor IF-2
MLKSDSQVRIMRGKRNPIYTGTLSSLKVVKEVTAEVPNGSECGMSFTGNLHIYVYIYMYIHIYM